MSTSIVTARNPLKTPFPLTVARMLLWVRTLSGVLPIYLVNEFPKSGGTWVKNMLAAALDLPPWTRTEPVWSASVMQGHLLRPHGLVNTLALFRDGRDVMVSYYYHSFFVNEHFNAGYVARMRNAFAFADYEDIRGNLLPFMRTMFEYPVSPGFTWVDFAEVWAKGRAKVTARYEDLRADTPGELQRIVHAISGRELSLDKAREIAADYSMVRMRNRQVSTRGSGQLAEKSFIREGSVGGWTRHFTDEALRYFEAKAGNALDLLGYAHGRPDDLR